MKLQPRYAGPVVLTTDDPPESQLTPTVRQHRRFDTVLNGLSDDQWNRPSRCDGWSVRDVAAHLVSTHEFWTASVSAGLTGAPSQMLVGFDPATTPPLLVGTLASLSRQELLTRFSQSSEAFLSTLAALTSDQWSLPAETPVGHVPIRLLAQHALWDSWIHERDVLLPLGLAPTFEPDEVESCLRYAAALSPVLELGLGGAESGTVGIEATDPTAVFTIEVGDSVAIRSGPIPDDVPVLRGDAVALTEALSLRSALPESAAPEWRRRLRGLETAFDAS